MPFDEQSPEFMGLSHSLCIWKVIVHRDVSASFFIGILTFCSVFLPIAFYLTIGFLFFWMVFNRKDVSFLFSKLLSV